MIPRSDVLKAVVADSETILPAPPIAGSPSHTLCQFLTVKLLFQKSQTQMSPNSMGSPLLNLFP